MSIGWSRRSVIGGLFCLSSVASGCVEDDNTAYEESIAGLGEEDQNATPRTREVELAHWFPEGAFHPIAESLSGGRPIELRGVASPDRHAMEREVADRIVAAEPPSLFQTVLGDELWRYATVAAIDSIPDIMDSDSIADVREPLQTSLVVDRDPYAVPITMTPLNVLLVDVNDLEDDGIAPDSLTSPSELLDVVQRVPFGVRESGQSAFHLAVQLLLGRHGGESYARAREGALGMDELRETLHRTADFLGHARRLPRFPRSSDVTDCSIVLFDTEVAAVGLPEGWTPIPFPGTVEDAVATATGICLPTRGQFPGTAAHVLDHATDPEIQQRVATSCGRLPACHRDGSTRPDLEGIVASADRVRPSISTGCGFDPDIRWRAITAFESANWDDPDGITDTLSPFLS